MIYNLTELGSRATVKPTQLIILYTKKIKSLEADLEHLKVTLQTYAQSLARIADMLDWDSSLLKPNGASADSHQQLAEQLRAIEVKLAEYKEGKETAVPVMIERVVEVEVPVEVVREK